MATVIPIEELRRTATAALFEGGDEAAISIFVTEFERGQGPALHLHFTRKCSSSRAAPPCSRSATKSSPSPEATSWSPRRNAPRFIGTGDDTLRVIGVHPSGAVQQTDL